MDSSWLKFFSDPRDLYCLAHALSQLSYTYVGCPNSIRLDDDSDSLTKKSRDHWRLVARAFLDLIKNHSFGLLPKLEAFFDFDVLAAAVHEHLSCIRANGAKYVLLCDRSYPESLRHIEQPPQALSVVGFLAENRPRIAIVGARKASLNALQQSFNLAALFAENETIVVSGGAFGCDLAAHQGVLATTVDPLPACIVFAGGLGQLYPQANRWLFEQVRKRDGVLISEKLWTQKCRKVDFPIRNRIISGLSEKVFIMQAAERSGAMITARAALEQGREVFVLIDDVSDRRQTGNVQLLRDGAYGFDSVEALSRGVFVAFTTVEEESFKISGQYLLGNGFELQ